MSWRIVFLILFFPALQLEAEVKLIPTNKIPVPGPLRDYSGITWMGGNTFLIIDDKSDGFFYLQIRTDRESNIVSAELGPFIATPAFSNSDIEGIAYNPTDKTVFLSEEKLQRIEGFSLSGKYKKRIDVPQIFMAANGSNRGFESLTYCRVGGKYWTTTEDGLPQDGGLPGYGKDSFVRLQEFNSDLSVGRQYAYRIDPPKGSGGDALVYGVSDMACLPDGSLLVMEREANSDWFFSYMDTRIYRVIPAGGFDVSSFSKLSEAYSAHREIVLEKTLLWSHSTNFLDPTNYEGICLGRRMSNGDYQVFIISDAGAGSYNQKQYLQAFLLRGIEDKSKPGYPFILP